MMHAEAANADQHWNHDSSSANSASGAKCRGKECEDQNDAVIRVQRQQRLFHRCSEQMLMLLAAAAYAASTRFWNAPKGGVYVMKPTETPS